MNKKELHKFNNRFNSFALAFEQLKKAQHRNSIDKSITINDFHFAQSLEHIFLVLNSSLSCLKLFVTHLTS